MLRKTKRVLGFVILAVIIFSFAYFSYINITDSAPSIFGYRLLRVSTDSMEPELSAGEIVIAKHTEPDELKFGDVISYKAEKGYLKGSLVTHQISKEPYEKDGVYYYTTRGIRPEAVDDPEITYEQIIGKVLYKIPFAGTVYDFFTNWYGMVLLGALFIIIFADDFISIYKKIREKHGIEDDSDHKNIKDLQQSEYAMNQRLNEFEGIITNLDDPDL